MTLLSTDEVDCVICVVRALKVGVVIFVTCVVQALKVGLLLLIDHRVKTSYQLHTCDSLYVLVSNFYVWEE